MLESLTQAPNHPLTPFLPVRAGAAARSFTSTAVNPTTRNARQMVRVERHPKAKAYLRLHTSLGDLNLELHCDIAPRACENFLVLLESGYYTGTPFHRCIRNFMIQVWRACVWVYVPRGMGGPYRGVAWQRHNTPEEGSV